MHILTSYKGRHDVCPTWKFFNFLFSQGRQNDTTKEFTLAKKKGKFIVSPHWLDACLDEDCHVDEALYPHTYNPKMSLNVVTSAQRVTRSMVSPNENLFLLLTVY